MKGVGAGGEGAASWPAPVITSQAISTTPAPRPALLRPFSVFSATAAPPHTAVTAAAEGSPNPPENVWCKCVVLKLAAPRRDGLHRGAPRAPLPNTHRLLLLLHARRHLRHRPVDCIELGKVRNILLHIHRDGLGGIELPRPKLAHVGGTEWSSSRRRLTQHAACRTSRAAALTRTWRAPPTMCPWC